MHRPGKAAAWPGAPAARGRKGSQVRKGLLLHRAGKVSAWPGAPAARSRKGSQVRKGLLLHRAGKAAAWAGAPPARSRKGSQVRKGLPLRGAGKGVGLGRGSRCAGRERESGLEGAPVSRARKERQGTQELLLRGARRVGRPGAVAVQSRKGRPGASAAGGRKVRHGNILLNSGTLRVRGTKGSSVVHTVFVVLGRELLCRLSCNSLTAAEGSRSEQSTAQSTEKYCVKY